MPPPVVNRRFPFPTKCTNCCCALVMGLNKKDGDGRAPPGPGVTAIRVPSYSESEVPMSLILSYVLNLPKDSACISNVLFCHRCASFLVQIFKLILALEKFSQAESQLSFIQNKVRNILQKFPPPVIIISDVAEKRKSAEKTSTNPGTPSPVKRDVLQNSSPPVISLKNVEVSKRNTAKSSTDLGTRSAVKSKSVFNSAEKLTSDCDSVDTDEPMDFSLDSDPIEMEIKPDISNSNTTSSPEVLREELTARKDNRKRIVVIAPTSPKVTKRAEILTASKLLQRQKSGNAVQLVPLQNSTTAKPTTPQGRSVEMVKPILKQEGLEVTVVPGLVEVQPQQCKSSNVNPAAASLGSSRRKQVLKPFEQATNTVTENMLVYQINENEGTVPLPVLPVPKKDVTYQTIVRRRFKGNCSKCEHVFSNASLLDIEQHFDDKHDGMLEYICNFCEKRRPGNYYCITLHYKTHTMLIAMERKKNFRSSCGLNLEVDTSPRDKSSGHKEKSVIEKRKETIRTQYMRAVAIKRSKRKVIPAFKHGPCPYCGKTFVNRAPNWMESHINLNHRFQSKCSCDICGKPFRTITLVKKHKWSHLNSVERLELEAKEGIQKEFLCSECGKVLTSEHLLKTHQKNMHGDLEARRLVCQEPGCEFSCLSETTLKFHYVQVHDPNTEPFHYCKQCNKGFRVHAELKKHEMLECDFWNRPFACDLDSCYRRFKTKQAVVIHLNGFHKLSPAEARAKVYPGLDCPAWVGRKFKSSKEQKPRKSHNIRSRFLLKQKQKAESEKR